MKISIVHASVSGFDQGVPSIVKTIIEILNELNVDIQNIGLSSLQIPFYDGIKSNTSANVLNHLKESDGVIFATTAQLFAPCGVMQTFLEHLLEDKTVLQGKNCMLISVSNTVGAKDAVEYLAKIVNYLNAYDSVKVAIDGNNQKLIGKDDKFQQILEKQIEDFYRFVGQNRKFFIPQSSQAVSTGINVVADQNTDLAQSFTSEEYETILQVDKRPKLTTDELYKKVSLESFTQKQEEDINEIAQLFASKYTSQAPANESYNMPYIKPKPEVAAPAPRPRAISCKQLTQSLPHYFQPQLASGNSFTVQLSINGEENFEGFITVNNSDCNYTDGAAPMPDITILSDSRIWSDILKGKHTAQKAFMIGQIKVRGNFVLLSKFEQLFKTIT